MAERAIDAMRRRAETEIEKCFEAAFRERILVGLNRRLEVWVSPQEGKRTAEIFADLEEVSRWRFGESVEPFERMRRKYHAFVVDVPIYAQG
jgi:hypothetical protein